VKIDQVPEFVISTLDENEQRKIKRKSTTTTAQRKSNWILLSRKLNQDAILLNLKQLHSGCAESEQALPSFVDGNDDQREDRELNFAES
jgi:hypothetical protein